MGIGTSSSAAFEPIDISSNGANSEPIDDDDPCCLIPPYSSSVSGKTKPHDSSAASAERKSSRSAAQAKKVPRLPKPKKLLWGCSNAEEHYQYIADICGKIKHLHGEEGMSLLNLQYQMVHHPNCECDVDMDKELDPSLWAGQDDGANVGDANGEHNYEDIDTLQDDWQLADEYMVPIDMPIVDGPPPKDDYFSSDDSNVKSTPDLNGSTDHHEGSNFVNSSSRSLTKSISDVSLFSLATHHTWTTGEDHPEDLEHECALRLVHVPPATIDRPPTLIESDNYENFIANGVMYDEVSRLCVEYSQSIMQEEGDLIWVSICNNRGIRALVSRNRVEGKPRKKVLLVVTGKGKVRAGIFSRRHVITTGIEASTALPYVREARRRSMDIIMLDPNSNGDVNGMSTVDTSLRFLFSADDANENEEVYVLAHSMAGAQMVRYLHGNNQVGEAVNTSNSREDELKLFRLIKAFAFTDSNHNINWTKKTNPALTDMLVGEKSLYVKSHKIHEDEPKQLGMPHHDCQFWRHRFGDIRTIWAGTYEHALTNYTARDIIWDHFDSFSSDDC